MEYVPLVIFEVVLIVILTGIALFALGFLAGYFWGKERRED